MARQISNHFGSSQGVADEEHILQIECVHDRGNVVGEAVVIISVTGLLGTPMTPPVECDATPSPFRKSHHRDIPPIGAECPARHENDRPASAPIPKMNSGPIPAFDHIGVSSNTRGLFSRGSGVS